MDNEFFRNTTVTGKQYDIFKCIKILNAQQAAYYMSRGVELKDIKLSNDRRTGKPCLVYYFYRDETKSAYDEWCNMKKDN